MSFFALFADTPNKSIVWVSKVPHLVMHFTAFSLQTQRGLENSETEGTKTIGDISSKEILANTEQLYTEKTQWDGISQCTNAHTSN